MPAAQRDEDERWMREAVSEGSRGLGRTSPNPAVGCVLVRKGREVARGHHRRAGLPHAEAVALASAGRRARGSTAYVTLEPHAHQGRTPPCTDALLRAGVVRVVVGCVDPNPLVAGRGLRQLRAAGVDVQRGVLEAECADLTRGYGQFIVEHRPFVHLKLAATLDGRIGASGGPANIAATRGPVNLGAGRGPVNLGAARGPVNWITGPAARRFVHGLRARSEAVLVGVGTVLADDPRLTCRSGGRHPLRVVLDPRLQTPPGARMFSEKGRTLVVAAPDAPARRRRALERVGAEVELRDTRGKRGWEGLLRALADRGVMELLVEGGASVAASAVRAGVVNRLSIFYNPRLLGGDGVPMIAALGIRQANAAVRLRRIGLRDVGGDLLWEGEFE